MRAGLAGRRFRSQLPFTAFCNEHCEFQRLFVVQTRINLRTIRAYLLKEEFQFFWEYVSPAWAEKFMDQWCKKVMRSRIEPMKKVARMLKTHRELILNWFRAKGTIYAGSVEGFNNKAKLTTRRAYGFRTPPPHPKS